LHYNAVRDTDKFVADADEVGQPVRLKQSDSVQRPDRTASLGATGHAEGHTTQMIVLPCMNFRRFDMTKRCVG